jgi:hypothetical protein
LTDERSADESTSWAIANKKGDVEPNVKPSGVMR